MIKFPSLNDQDNPMHEEIKKGINFIPVDSHRKLPKKILDSGLTIIPFGTDKSDIKIRDIMKDKIIPTHPSSVIFNGRSGSGKTQLMINLLCKPNFYGRDSDGKTYFDKVYMFSPTANLGDDLCKHIVAHGNLKKDDIYNEFDETTLMSILKEQEQKIKATGIAKSPKVLIVLDDIQSCPTFLRSKTVLKIFIQNRHCNVSTWLCSQVFNKIPRACRLQANNLFVFPCSRSEQDRMVEEFAPPKHTKFEFNQLIDYAHSDPHSFLHINMKDTPKTRFRKNLDEILELKK